MTVLKLVKNREKIQTDLKSKKSDFNIKPNTENWIFD